MTYDFSTRLDRVGERMQELHDNSLTYSRSGELDLTITNFTPEKADVDQLIALGIVVVNEKWQDFVFDVADMSTWTIPEPRTGDKIVWGTLTFQVTSIGDETFKYTTSTRKRVRVHSKQVKT